MGKGWKNLIVRDQEEEGLDFDVTDAMGMPTGETVTLAGPHSELYKSVTAEFFKKSRLSKNSSELKFEDYVFPRVILKWTFEDECTLPAREQFLEDLPWMKDKMNFVYADFTRFFLLGRNHSLKKEDTPNASSVSGNETNEA